MKREIDKNGRLLYKFSSSVSQGGYVYAHKTKTDSLILNKDGLRNALNAIAKQYELIDVTIKVYDNIFFLFFMMKSSVGPQRIIDTIQRNLASFSEWAEDYIYSGVYDLQEKHVRNELQKWGFNYEHG